MNLSIGKITIRDAGGAVLGTVEKLAEHKHEYRVKRIIGYAGSHADAIKMLRDLNRILPRTPKEQDRGTTRARTEPSETSG